MHQWLGVRPFSKAFRVKAWIIPSVLGSLLLSLPVHAAQLQFWRFDPGQNRLSFTTSGAVQPRVQLIPNPTRLVVDLPGTQLNRPTVKQTLTGTVRSVRVGQFDGQTARIVVELAPNYVVDPSLVKVTPSSASNWSIDLPQPRLIGTNSPRPQPLPSQAPVARPVARPAATPPPAPATNDPILSDISVTPDGLFFGTSKAPENVTVRRSRGRKQVKVTLKGMRANPQLLGRTFKPGYYGLRELSVQQVEEDSKIDTEVLFTIDKNGPSWTATTSRFGGVVVIPQSRGLRPSRPSSTVSILRGPAPATVTQQATAATIESVSLGGDRLLVKSDQPIAYTTAWEGSSYRLTLQAAQLARGVQAPRVAVGSPLSSIQFRQDPQGLSILSTPARGVRISGIQRLSDTQVLLLLRRAGQAPLPSVVRSGSNSSGNAPPISTGPLPRPQGRRVVVIDPGHGGRDPGAIGINGLRETNVVLPISLDVSRILQRQGVTVYLTRTDEREIDLAPRVALAERVRANVFVSIHANAISLSRPDVNGLETYYAPGSSSGKRLADTIHRNVLGNVNIGSRGVRSARFYVIRRTSMPAALVETGFVTGAIDNPKLANPAFRRQMAEAIARGILEYLSRN